MSRFVLYPLLLLLMLATAVNTAAGGSTFRYKLKPGDTWLADEASESRTEMMGTSSVTRTKRTVRYQVQKGPRQGWVMLRAEIVALTSQTDKEPVSRQNVLAGMVFTADMHASGEVRNYQCSGGNPQMAQYLCPAMRAAIFRFPEFPEDALVPGDEFDDERRMEMPGMQGMGGMQAAMRLTYTLEEVSQGLATFSVKQRTAMQGSGMEIKDAGLGEALFDLRAGMWIEHETKSKSVVGAGMGSGGETYQASRMTLEKK